MRPGPTHGLAIGLSMLGGFVDALGYLALGGLFVAFMSGNSTVLGNAAVEQDWPRTALAGGIIAMFVLGVMLGTWVGRPFGSRRAPVVLLLMAALLAAAAGLCQAGMGTACCLVVALAMGTENTILQKDGAPGIGLTYMTGTLVRVGQRLAEAMVGGPWGAAIPDISLWCGMVAGAGLGTLVYHRIGLNGLWGAIAVTVLIAGGVWLGQRPGSPLRQDG